MKIKAPIKEIVLANRMIRIMQEHGFSPDRMLRVIKLSREMFNDMNSHNKKTLKT